MDRFAEVIKILQASNERLRKFPDERLKGFLAVEPKVLANAIRSLLNVAQPPKTSLDLGCGNGGWLLLAAAAGFESYGIELNPLLVNECKRNYEECVKRNLINVPVIIIQGDMIPPAYREGYEKFAKHHAEVKASMPDEKNNEDCYTQSKVNLKNVDIIYCWAWPTQSRFLFNMLEKETNNPIFILPAYIRYTQGEHMNESLSERNELILQELVKTGTDVFIGKRLFQVE